jgi:hypothetical protein
MSTRTDVLLWAQRVLSRGPGASAHQILEIRPDATVDQAQTAFHRIAKSAHPDLHRTTLSKEEFEQVTLAYARAAGAYQDFRQQAMQLGKRAQATTPPGIAGIRPFGTSSTPPTGEPAAAPRADATAPRADAQMNGKALIYYRKAELCLNRGDFKTGLLNLKMAIAADPQSTFLRSALAKVEEELKK